MRRIFVTGIGTDVGKTVVSAVLTEALSADYWKPVQTGKERDMNEVKRLVSNKKSHFHKESIWLNEPASPHLAAALENRSIGLKSIEVPTTNNHLIVEGAGGLMVPFNNEELMIDLIEQLNFEVVLVIKHYLGSINHSILSIEMIKSRGLNLLGVVISGNNHLPSEDAIIEHTGVKILGTVNQLDELNADNIKKASNLLMSI